jgi:mono/diheme cytochrome c family protein
MKSDPIWCLLIILALWTPALSQTTTDKAFTDGRILFQTNCSSCHNIHNEVLGPQLASITKKRTEDWLLRFIRNSQSVIAGGDSYAIFLFERYHHQVMPSFRTLNETEIKSILHYIEIESLSPSNDLASGINVDQESSPSVFHGQMIFQLQCQACHFIDHEGGCGPSLGSVPKRHPNRWLKAFIRNSQKVIQSGDPYAVHLFDRFDHRVMVSMEFLQDEDIDDVLNYIKYRASSDHATGGASGRETQFGKRNSEIHGVRKDKPLEGASIIRDVVIILIASACVVYGLLLTRVFNYLQAAENKHPGENFSSEPK